MGRLRRSHTSRGVVCDPPRGRALRPLIIGSFLNVVIHRVPLYRSIVSPSLSCPDCGVRIKTLDNVPVLSYLLLRRRCGQCGVRISPRYPLVEALTGVLFALAAYEFGISLALVWALVLLSALVTLAGIAFVLRYTRVGMTDASG